MHKELICQSVAVSGNTKNTSCKMSPYSYICIWLEERQVYSNISPSIANSTRPSNRSNLSLNTKYSCGRNSVNMPAHINLKIDKYLIETLTPMFRTRLVSFDFLIFRWNSVTDDRENQYLKDHMTQTNFSAVITMKLMSFLTN